MRNILILVLACSLLLGCAQNAPQPTGNGTGTIPADGGNATVPANPAVQNDSAAAAENASQGQGQVPPAKTYSAGFSALIGMGIPLECEINYTYSGKPVTARMLIGKDSDIRVESAAGMVQCQKTITIIRGSRQYVGCSDKAVMPSCDWFKSGYDETNPGVASNFDFSIVPASSIACHDWTADDSVFRTNGTICEMG
jgi:hypothetical protein